MNQTIILCICFFASLFLFFYSPKEKNILGYKSLQQNLDSNVWKWSNKCFGGLSLLGSILFSIIHMYNKDMILFKYILIYILISFVITELYVFIQRIRSKR